jgi:hypothetical protein
MLSVNLAIWELNNLGMMLTSALRLPLARLPFSPFMNITPLFLRMGAGWLLWRLTLLRSCSHINSGNMGVRKFEPTIFRKEETLFFWHNG